MKFIKLFIFLILSTCSFAQKYRTQVTAPTLWKDGKFDTLHIPFRDTITSLDRSPGEIVLRPQDTSVYISTSVRWNKIGSGSISGGSAGTLPFGGAITSVPTVGFNPNTTDVVQWISNSFYGSQSPTASISGGTTMELMGTGPALSVPLSWSAARLSATAPISTIVVNGVNQTFSQPGPGASALGTYNASVTRNTNTTIAINVTTTDGKTATANTSVIFSPKRYFGWVNSTNPSDGDILATSSEFSTAIAKSWIQTAPAGSQNLMYATPANEGSLTDITINGFPSIQAFTQVQRLFTNASGYTQLYSIYISTNKFSVTGTTTVSAQ